MPTHSDRLTVRNSGLRLLAGLFVTALVFAQAAFVLASQSSEELLVNDPRPLAAAIQQFERRCHCVATYEDVKWRQDQLEDVSALVRRRPDAPRPHVPKGGPFLFTVTRQLESATPAQIAISLRELLAAFERSGHSGSFRLVESNGAFHILPNTGGVLDSPIALAQGDRSLAQTIEAILVRVTKSTGEDIVLATGPLNLMNTTVQIAAQNERAGDVLSRALSATGRKMSWQLLYDFGMKRYYLSLHFVS